MRLLIAMNQPAKASIWRWPASSTARLRQQFPALDVIDDAELPGAFAEADAIVAWQLPPDWPLRAPRLRWVHCPSAAVHQLLTPELVASRVTVTNGASVHAATVAEHTLALMLALARDLPRAVEDQRLRRWQPSTFLPQVSTLAGAQALIVGMGNIGRALAAMLRGLGMQVEGLRREEDAQLEARLPDADYVILALPVTPGTQARFAAPQFAAMRQGARFINIGRGQSLDEAALLAALDSGRLAAAALDVFTREPLPEDSPLWRHPRLLITPHVAAATPDTWARQADLIAYHLRQFLVGAPLTPQVDKLRGY
ncbi:MAG TPA: D-2-hydroxyacid dehydrogenase [Terriglobales bacterium]|nr:D-2-hydroxyacid dehydrogenase [Terriglobales bacterium]